VLIIDGGRVIADDTADRLKANLVADLIRLTTGDDEHARRAAAMAERVPGATAISADAATVQLRAPAGAAALPELIRAMAAAGIAVLTAEVRRPTLDDVFLALTGRSLREADA
jgi:ABC-2 type transport system ATP-binding protein